jgi:hypothetical protein
MKKKLSSLSCRSCNPLPQVEEEEAIHLSLPLVVEPEKSNNGTSLFSFTWKQSISLSLIWENKSYVSSRGKQTKKKKKQSISFSLWKAILCLMWKQQQKEKQSSLSLSLSLSLTCGNDPLSHVEAEE